MTTTGAPFQLWRQQQFLNIEKQGYKEWAFNLEAEVPPEGNLGLISNSLPEPEGRNLLSVGPFPSEKGGRGL